MADKKYLPTGNSDRVTDAIMAVYDGLPDDERLALDRYIKVAKSKIDTRKGVERKMIGKQGIVELVGKLGMWMNKQERKA